MWHTKKGKYAPSTKITAKAMQEQFYLYKGLPFSPTPSVNITRADMKTTEEPEEGMSLLVIHLSDLSLPISLIFFTFEFCELIF